MVYLHPLQWQHTFVPILSGQMLDFVMAPTSFLMGCHLDHFEEVRKVREGAQTGVGGMNLCDSVMWLVESCIPRCSVSPTCSLCSERPRKDVLAVLECIVILSAGCHALGIMRHLYTHVLLSLHHIHTLCALICLLS